MRMAGGYALEVGECAASIFFHEPPHGRFSYNRQNARMSERSESPLEELGTEMIG